MFDFSFYKGKKVLVTGHTGFKGAWLSRLLLTAGAEVTGYALEPPTAPALFDLCALSDEMHSVTGDIRNLDALRNVFEESRPEIVIHMAAQPIVRRSYQEPIYTYETNVMGTVNLLECIRHSDSVQSVVNVTTDKVYRNREWDWPYRECDELNGYDPYSNSKSCSELVTGCYINSFLREKNVAVSAVRAGNVIGGGDFSADRIIPDCVRAAQAGQEIVVRNPDSIRPYQHVLEALAVYLMIAQRQYEDRSYAGCYNVGPDEADCVATGVLVSGFCEKWSQYAGESISWAERPDGGPHEAKLLKLDCARLKSVFGWKANWHFETALEKTVEWYADYVRGRDVRNCMEKQILDFCRTAVNPRN